MIRKATAFTFLLLLGLHLSVAALPVCLCVSPQIATGSESCCEAEDSCCEAEDSDDKGCCGEPGCCIVIPVAPDGMELKLLQIPGPISLPLPMIRGEEIVALPMGSELVLPRSLAPPPGAPVRVIHGVWRL